MRRRPELVDEANQQQRVATLLASGGPCPSDRLIDAGDIAAALFEARAPSRRTRRRIAVVGGLATLTVLAAVLTVPLNGRSDRSIVAAVRLVYSPSTGPPPALSSRRFIAATFAGIRFPNYAHRFGARPTGRRADRLFGRTSVTVFYGLRGGQRVSYTVFAGPPVQLPSSARQVVFDGARFSEFAVGALSAVTLVRFGHTCVLAAATSPKVLLALAAAPIRDQL